MKRTNKNRRSEQGMALLIALFALLLLSAVGLAMMYSSTTETSINSNFRDKQIAAYASVSGALEARDRLQPATGDIAAPNGLPTAGSPNVIYIVNPSSVETVTPWTYSSKYADTEFCQENLSSTLGVTQGTVGIPCSGSTSLPSGSGWYTVKDDSSSGSYGSSFLGYKQSTPLTYKWTRITLKADNMTPVGSDGNPGTGNQVCWDGKNQVTLPTGSGSSCTPTGSVTGVTLTNQGSGYSSPPTVTIGPPASGGAQATATAQISPTTSSGVLSATVTATGSGYQTAPLVSFSGGNGIGATAVATIQPYGGPVTAVSLTNAGTGCYAAGSPPSVAISGGGGNGAQASSTLETTPSCILSWSASGSCSADAGTTKTVGATGGSGSGFSGTITFGSAGNGNGGGNGNGRGNGNGGGTTTGGLVAGVTITAPGTGYTTTPTAVTGLSGCSITPSFNLGYHVASLAVTAGGSGYTSTPTVTVALPNAGTQPTGSATVGPQPANAGQLTGITITNPGSGYTSAPIVVVDNTGTSGTGGAGIAIIGNVGMLTGITVTNGGSGYALSPTVTISGGGGSGATGVAAVSSGTYYGQVYLITSFAQTPSGSKAITQMEVASAVRSFSPTAALTLDGPSPTYYATTSNNFFVSGTDANSCGDPSAASTKPAVGVFDNPNSPTSPTAQSTVITSVSSGGAKPANYTGSKPAPDIENVYGSLGDSMTTPTGMEVLANAIASIATNTYPSNYVYPNYPPPATTTSINLGTSSVPVVDVVNGDLSLSGSSGGYGILLVRGNLTMSGNFSWHGPIFVIGQGSFTAANGAGNGQLVGDLYIAKTRDSSLNLLGSLGSPYVNFNGGGNNYIQYDHCWADKFYAKIPYVPPPPTTPLHVISTRTVTY